MRKKLVSFKLPPAIAESIKKQAGRKGISQAFLVEIAYREWLERNQESEEKQVVAPIGFGQTIRYKRGE